MWFGTDEGLIRSKVWLAFIILCTLFAGAFAQPTVNLGPDVFACGSATLNAGNPGAAYIWSTGDTTQTLLVSVSGIYWVDVTDGSGTARDSITATITSTPAPPVVNDTSVCGGAPFSLGVSTPSDQVIWYEAATGGQIFGVGNPLFLSINTDRTLHPQAINFGAVSKVGHTTFPSLLYATNLRGLTFDVFAPVTIHSVVLYSNIPTDVTIYVVNSSNQTLVSRRVQIPGIPNKAERIPIFFDIPAGNNFKILGQIHSGRLALPSSGAAFPYVAPGLVSIKSADNGNLANVNYFFDWEISRAGCRSPREQVTLTALPTPVVNLGPNRVICGGTGALLNAFNAGAAYIWSTGATDSAIVATTDGTYSVTANLAGCIATDTVSLFFLPEASDPLVSDTAVCANIAFTAVAGATANKVLWYDAPSNGKIREVSATIGLNLSDTTTLYPQAFNHGPVSKIGQATFPNLLYVNQTRGLLFDALTDITLHTVVLYANQPTDVTIFVQNAANQTIATTRVQIPGIVNQPARVPLYFDIPSGSNYKLMGQIHSGQLSLPGSGVTYPYILPGQVSIKSADNGNLGNYNYFFDWEVSRLGCRSNRVPVTFFTLPTPVVNFGPDQVVCGAGPLLLSAANAGATYLWNTGDTTATLAVTQDGIYHVRAETNGCVARDTIEALFLPAAATPLRSDTTVCARISFDLQAQSSTNTVVWINPLTQQVAYQGSSIRIQVADTTEFIVRGVNHLPAAQVGAAVFPGLLYTNTLRGLRFDVFRQMALHSVAVYTNQPTDVTIQLRNAAGQTLVSKRVQLPGLLNQPQRVPLFFDIPPGLNYQLLGEVHSGQLALPASGVAFPYTVANLVSIKSANDGNLSNFNYFFDWTVSRPVCFSEPDTVRINALPTPVAQLGRDTLICGAGPYVVSVAQPGASYLWSDGSTQGNFVFTGSDTVSVEISIGICQARDTVAVEFLEAPQLPDVADTLFCGGGLLEVAGAAAVGQVVWYSSSNGAEVLGSGPILPFSTRDSVTIYAEAIHSPQVFVTGRTNPGQLVYVNTTRGLRFDAVTDIHLRAVTVYSQAPTVARVYLMNDAGQTLYSVVKQIKGVNGAATELELYFDIPRGENYRLMAEILSGGLGLPGNLAGFPFVRPGIIRIKADHTGATSNYNFFFAWQISKSVCRSPRIPVRVDIKYPIAFESYVYACDTFQVTASTNASGTFAWSTGETGNTISIGQSGTYSVTITDPGGCEVRDTLVAEIPVNAGLPADGILCGNVLTTNYGPEATHVWSTGDSTATVTISTPGAYSVRVLEPRGCDLRDTIMVTGFDSFPVVNLGADFSVCDSAILDAANPGLSFLWSTGETTQTIVARSSGNYVVRVTNANDCAAADTIAVFIAPSPVADFFVPDTVISPDLTVQFINQSTFGLFYWEFGDGSNSNGFNPLHGYPGAGNYCVRLTVSDINNNCGNDTVEKCFTLLRYPTSTDLLTGLTWKAYPVPARDWLYVESMGGQGQAGEIGLWSITGAELARVALTDNRAEMDVKGFAPGIYLLTVRIGGRLAGRKLVELR